MAPYAQVTGAHSPRITIGLLEGEDKECLQAAWGSGIITASDQVQLVAEGSTKYTLESAEQVIEKQIGMPAEMAHALVEAASRLDDSVRVEAETVFEQKGRVGGPRHYENFRI